MLMAKKLLHGEYAKEKFQIFISFLDSKPINFFVRQVAESKINTVRKLKE